MSVGFRIGFGYDIHRLVEGRRLILGGVEIEYEKGLLGHSDADCLIHALADALLGAAGLRDIGYYFPDKDPKYKDIDSKILLKEVVRKIDEAGFYCVNFDSTIIAQEPKIGPYIQSMKESLNEILQIGESCIGIKATTNEQLDAIGSKEAIATHVVCFIVAKG